MKVKKRESVREDIYLKREDAGVNREERKALEHKRKNIPESSYLGERKYCA